MPKNRILRLVDYEKLYNDTLDAKIINDPRAITGQSMSDYIKNLFYQIDDELGFVPSCECHEFRGNHFIGQVCPYCGTVVSSQFANTLTNTNWIGIPEHMPKVLHPVFYCIMKDWIGKAKRIRHSNDPKKTRGRKVSLIESILNPEEELLEDIRHVVKKQGFTYFYEHHEEIMNFLLNEYSGAKFNKLTPDVRKLYELYKDRMFTDKLPILHQSLHPVGKEGRMKTMDSTAGLIFPAITDLTTSTFASRRCITSPKYIDKILWKVYKNYILYVETITVKKIGDKFAHLRRHAIGARVHYSIRGVIVPIVDRHEGDEIYLPWAMALNGLKNEILNVLMNRENYSLNEALKLFMRALVIYDPKIDSIIQMLMKECPYKGFPVLLGRNPTLVHGSIYLLFCTRVKTDLNDQCISFSSRICKAPNADYDGDELWGILIKEMSMVQYLMGMHPRENLLSESELAVSGLVTPTTESTIHINSFIATAYDIPESVRFEL